MRKARRAEMHHQDPSTMPYPQYGYPPPGPPAQDPYLAPPGIYNPAANNFNTSMGSFYSPQPQQQMPMGMDQSNFNIPTQLFQNQAVANAALQYGQSMVGQAKDKIDQELNKYVSASRVKYFFSVDTVYVIKKLILLMFPFTHAVSLFSKSYLYTIFHNLNIDKVITCFIIFFSNSRTGLSSIILISQFNLGMN